MQSSTPYVWNARPPVVELSDAEVAQIAGGAVTPWDTPYGTGEVREDGTLTYTIDHVIDNVYDPDGGS